MAWSDFPYGRTARLSRPLPNNMAYSQTQPTPALPTSVSGSFKNTITRNGSPTRPANSNSLFEELFIFPDDNDFRVAQHCHQYWHEGSQFSQQPRVPNLRLQQYDPVQSGEVRNRNSSLATSDASGSCVVLAHPVDSSMYEEIREEDWVLSSRDYESAVSPSSINTHSAGPETPRSPFAGNEFPESGPDHQNDAHWLNKTSGKVDNSPCVGDPPSPWSSLLLPQSSSSFSSSFTVDQPFTAFSAPSSFGSLTYAGYGAQPIPSGDYTSAISYHGNAASHAHGLSMGNCFYSQHLQPHQAPRPIMSPPIFQPADPLQDVGGEEDAQSGPEMTDTEDESEYDLGDQAVLGALMRRDRDRFLLALREKNVSYKEIKRLGKFREAESTLRGRVRVLTKDKSARVRHPNWLQTDETLLEQAMEHFAEFDHPGRGGGRDVHGRMPWKKISDWMHVHGGSYHFAPATCAKKWRMMNR